MHWRGDSLPDAGSCTGLGTNGDRADVGLLLLITRRLVDAEVAAVLGTGVQEGGVVHRTDARIGHRAGAAEQGKQQGSQQGR
jgi:hypothetical protein